MDKSAARQIKTSALTRPGLQWPAHAVSAVSAAIAYPLLFAAHGAAKAHPLAADGLLVPMFAVPVVGFLSARDSFRIIRPTIHQVRLRWLALAVVATPSLFVLLGVLAFMFAWTAPVWLIWTAAWAALGSWAAIGPRSRPETGSISPMPGLRLAHRCAAAAIAIFVAFHLFNHLAALAGPGTHQAIMQAGRRVYRFGLIEPVLVGLILFQAISGLRLLASKIGAPANTETVFQLASGAYLSAFIATHLNSVFVYARLSQHLETGWAFASGAPQGLLTGYTQLFPHYAYGVFLVLGHAASGVRNLVLRRGAAPAVARRAWVAGLALSAAVSAAIVAALCGLRLA